MVPRPIRLTSRPERPRCPYVISSPIRRAYASPVVPRMRCRGPLPTNVEHNARWPDAHGLLARRFLAAYVAPAARSKTYGCTATRCRWRPSMSRLWRGRVLTGRGRDTKRARGAVMGDDSGRDEAVSWAGGRCVTDGIAQIAEAVGSVAG